jgi:hypothetical protein
MKPTPAKPSPGSTPPPATAEPEVYYPRATPRPPQAPAHTPKSYLEALETAASSETAPQPASHSHAASHSASTPHPAASHAPAPKSAAAPAAQAPRAATAARPVAAAGATATASATPASAKGVSAPAAAPKAAAATAKAPAAGGDKPGGEPTATPNPSAAARKKQIIIIGAGALVVALLGVFAWSKMRPVDAPRLNSEPHVIGSFTATSAFERLPFEKKWQYYELMDDKEPALKAAYAAGKMNDDEYRKALQAAYYGKHLARMKKYFEKPFGRERTAYLDKLVQKKYEDDKDKKGNAKPAKSDSHSPLTAEEIKRDDTDQEGDISAWPADVRTKWEEYKKEYKARKDLFKQAREDEKARKNAPVTKPVAVPG